MPEAIKYEEWRAELERLTCIQPTGFQTAQTIANEHGLTIGMARRYLGRLREEGRVEVGPVSFNRLDGQLTTVRGYRLKQQPTVTKVRKK